MRRVCRTEGCWSYVHQDPTISAAGLCFKCWSASQERHKPWVRTVEVKDVDARGSDPEPPAEGETGIRCSGCREVWSLASFAPSEQARGAGYCRRCARERKRHRLGFARPTIE